MNKKGFSLIELMIAVALTAVVISAFYTLFNSLSIKYESNEKRSTKSRDSNKIYRLLYKDFLSAKTFNTFGSKSEKKVLILGNSTNTLHKMSGANISYVFNQKSSELFRIESQVPISLEKEISDDILDDSYIDLISNEISDFVVSGDENRNKAVILIEYADKSREIFGLHLLK